MLWWSLVGGTDGVEEKEMHDNSNRKLQEQVIFIQQGHKDTKIRKIMEL